MTVTADVDVTAAPARNRIVPYCIRRERTLVHGLGHAGSCAGVPPI